MLPCQLAQDRELLLDGDTYRSHTVAVISWGAGRIMGAGGQVGRASIAVA